jgi:rSAM/selenodomain-associated transferase 1
VIVFLKLPVAGRVKTRLGREIGMAAAAWWFRHAARRLLRRLRDPRWRLVLAVAPDTALASRVWPMDLPRRPQGAGDLGARMARALRAAAPEPAVVVGGDIPGLDRRRIAAAFVALGRAPCVFGPAKDGGYWLIGLRHPARQPRGFLRGVRWSTDRALADSRATAPPSALLEPLGDVDVAADLGGRAHVMAMAQFALAAQSRSGAP